jgi:hypothetical protein
VWLTQERAADAGYWEPGHPDNWKKFIKATTQKYQDDRGLQRPRCGPEHRSKRASAADLLAEASPQITSGKFLELLQNAALSQVYELYGRD